MMTGWKDKENIKTGLLVVLFVTTVLLLYVFWSDIRLDEINLVDFRDREEAEIPPVADMILPSEVDVYFGNDLYTVQEKNGEMWNACKEQLEEFGKNTAVTVETISEEKYREVLEYPHVTYRFLYHLPVVDYFTSLGASNTAALAGIGSFRTIVWSKGSQESLFFSNRENDSYYRVYAGNRSGSIPESMDRLEKSSFISCYSLGTFAENDTRTLVPLLLTSSISEIPWEEEFEKNDRTEITAYAETYFGENFDFIRKITEQSGNRIYMYGYGEKVLIVNADGSSEYKEEQQGTDVQTAFAAVETGMQYIAAHGGWPDEETNGFHLYLKSLQKIESEKTKGYRILFGAEAPDGEIYSESGSLAELEVIGGRVTYYYRDFPVIESQEYAKSSTTEGKETYSAINLLTENSTILANILEKNGVEISREDESDLFTSVCAKIKRVTPGYLMESGPSRKDRGKVLKPVWLVESDAVTFYFDLYSAEFIGTDQGEK